MTEEEEEGEEEEEDKGMAPASQRVKTRSGMGGLEDRPAITQDNGQEKHKGKQAAKADVLECQDPTTLTHKVSKLSVRESYRHAKDKMKRSRVASLFGIPKEETVLEGR